MPDPSIAPVSIAYQESDYLAYAINKMKSEEGYLQLHIRPCPWWLDGHIYRWLLGKVLFLKMFKG